ncbi:hypothetical protein KC878_04535 [Candidatus Saccharibacteria bacterium]|nr:hypothetical protein [Candidatus Saccharibacteria bacterium]MCB9821230.1 hypothetical protein [Candidatus Nomurabacteria bacterium]
MTKNNTRLSVKRLIVSRDQARTVLTIALTASVIAFCAVGSRVYFAKMRHQGRVIDAKQDTLQQLKDNIDVANKLEAAYTTFDSANESVLGNPDETNSRIVLDALPSKYDFAAVLTSVEKILSYGTYTVNRIEGIDQELEALQESATPEPVEIPLTISVSTNYKGAQQLLNDLYRSIRPMNIQKVGLSGSDDSLNLEIDLFTYYQPEKKLDVSTKEIK